MRNGRDGATRGQRTSKAARRWCLATIRSHRDSALSPLLHLRCACPDSTARKKLAMVVVCNLPRPSIHCPQTPWSRRETFSKEKQQKETVPAHLKTTHPVRNSRNGTTAAAAEHECSSIEPFGIFPAKPRAALTCTYPASPQQRSWMEICSCCKSCDASWPATKAVSLGPLLACMTAARLVELAGFRLKTLPFRMAMQFDQLSWLPSR